MCTFEPVFPVPSLAQVTGDVRLRDGPSSIYEGRVEIYRNGEWQSICDEGWDIEDADVVCKQLDYGYAESAPIASFYGISFNTVWNVNIECTGGEGKLLDCTNTNVSVCVLGEEAGVRCSNEGITTCTAHNSRVIIESFSGL